LASFDTVRYNPQRRLNYPESQGRTLVALKSAILSILGRDDLRWILDSLEIDDVDRHNVADMRAALADDPDLSGEQLLRFLSTDMLRQLRTAVKQVWQERRGENRGRTILEDVTPSPTMRKPLNIFAEGIDFKKDRGDWTPT
jgi:hypothetical protein